MILDEETDKFYLFGCTENVPGFLYEISIVKENSENQTGKNLQSKRVFFPFFQNIKIISHSHYTIR